ncbi:MAG: hypothetical protein ACJ741_10240 [Pyrinomonadaceae bacterium]
MGVGVRVFFVDSDDHLHRISVKRFEQLVLRKESSERFPEFAGERVRYALIIVEVEDRRPVAINRADYSILKLNDKGGLDTAEWDRRLQLAMNMMPPLMPEAKDSPVIDASSRFYKKRHEYEFLWQPSLEIVEAIKQAIFGNKD